LHALLHRFVAEGVCYVAMEVSSHALSQNRVDSVHFYAAVFTNLTQDHLDYHGDMQHYAEAKAKLFAWPHLKYAILDADDAYAGMMLKAAAPKTKCLMYSQVKHDSPFYFAMNMTHAEAGQSFDFYCDAGHYPVRTQLLGEFNIANLLASMTTLMALGFDMAALARLSIFIRPVLGRMETLRFAGLPLVVIDYAHTPDALEKVLQSLQLYDKTLWVVFGCGGDRDRSKRPQMAKIAEYYADHVIVTEDNNRFEKIELIFAEIRAGFCYPEKVHFLAQRTDAITYALKHAQSNDIVLLAGKGHETYLDKMGSKTHYDERAVVAGFLKLAL
jgi:UDP-N-acetylmuramoyl-L-alanyl-D-glutamate--2,6-diaminopimelate ligase